MSRFDNEAPRRVDRPEPGWFMMRLVRGGPYVPAKIVHNNGLWWAIINGEEKGKHHEYLKADMVHSVWVFGKIIPEHEYEFMLARVKYYRSAGIDHPSLEPNKTIRLEELPPLF